MDRVAGRGLEVVELADGVSLDDVRSCTGTTIKVGSLCRTLCNFSPIIKIGSLHITCDSHSARGIDRAPRTLGRIL